MAKVKRMRGVHGMRESDVPDVLWWEDRTGGTWGEAELRRQLRKPDTLGWVYVDSAGRVQGFMVYHSGLFALTVLNLCGTNEARDGLLAHARNKLTPWAAWCDGEAFTVRELVVANLFGVAS